MKCIFSPFHLCYCNIGSEEYYLSHFDEDLFYMYINDPCIVIGKNQNAFAEINREYVEANRIPVVRRLSGGGAVYHDRGNLNYGFIAKNRGKDVSEVFREFASPIVEALRSLGAPAEISGRNDIQLEGRKISGTAQYHSSSKVLFHGTLLFTSDLKAVEASLKVSKEKYQDKSVKSVGSRIINIRDYLPPMTIEDFSSIIMEKTLENFPEAQHHQLTEEEKAAIQALCDSKYSTWEWNFGSSMESTFRNSFRFEMGTVEIQLQVVGGRIGDIRLYGDFFGKKDVEEVCRRLRGVPYERRDMTAALAGLELSDYIFGLEKSMLINHML